MRRDSTRKNGTAELATVRFLNEKEVAELLGLSVLTLQQWRLRGRGPRWHRLGGPQKGAVRYRLDEVLKWAEAQPGGGE